MRLRRQRGSIKVRTHKDGTRVFDIYYRNHEGKLRHELGGNTKREAAAKLNERLGALQDGSYKELSPITFTEYTTAWLKGRELKPTARATYTSQLGPRDGTGKPHQLNPWFGARRMDTITTADLNTYIVAARSVYKLKSLKNQITLLNTIFEDAASQGHCQRNPLKHRTLQRPRAMTEAEDQEVVILTLAQVNQLLDALPPEHRAFFLTVALTGARLGEGLALQWQDINWTTQQVHIRRNVYKQRFYLPKSKASRRQVDVGPHLLGTLAALRQARYGAAPPPPEALIFATDTGKPLDPTNLRQRIWQPALKRAGLPPVVIHSLRHTFASQLIAQKENPKYIQRQLGHASMGITMNTYGHLFPQEPRRAATTLEEQLGLARGNAAVTDGADRASTEPTQRTRTAR